jgi:hypothetical protein
MKKAIFSFGVFISVSLSSMAQTPLCPVQVEGAFNATKLICGTLGDGEACIGNGIVEATPQEGVSDFAFSQPQERDLLINLAELRLRTLDTDNLLWSVVAINNILGTTEGSAAPTTMVVFGDATLDDDGDVVIQPEGQFLGTVIADFGLIIRRKPDPAGAIAWQLLAGETVTVTGQTADKTWYRVEIPSYYAGSGWVYAPYLEVSGEGNLPFVDESTPLPTPQSVPTIQFGTMQAFKLISALSDASCANTPDSGILMQTPNGLADKAKTRINGVQVEFNGTIFVQAQADANLRVTVLEGEATVISLGESSTAFANQAVLVGMNNNLEPINNPTTEQIDSSRYVTLPLGLLERPLAIAGSVVSAPTPELTATGDTAFATVTPATIEIVPTTSDALPTPVAVGSLSSAELGEICGKEPQSITKTADPGVSTTLGGLWTIKLGTTVTFEILGGEFQPLVNSFIKLQNVGGVVAQSGDQQNLTFTATADISFSAIFSSKAGDTLILTVRCGS